MGAVEVRSRLGELLARVRYAGERFLITRDGKEVAALVRVEDLERLERLEDLLDLATVRLLQARGEEPLPAEELLQQYEQLFGSKLEQPISG
ncbi:MAG: type II toxin-antitoxin system Phd/YefM family antitoxin [Candidatus Acetothermia bacterium]|nr:type II toxin-antitoxin system Phd/YefM family antitoxin [Candidatus Acetothermia bacterium]MDH7504837.1 type II toxin-antitoxin system prevent-host-death family antitoxin [Candidatus Acetothermia bacterium]